MPVPMKRLLVCSLLLIIFLSLAVRPCQGWSWACQFEVWSSPYHAHKIYAGALNCSRSFSAKLTGGIILPPLQIMTGLEGQDLQLFFSQPEAVLAASLSAGGNGQTGNQVRSPPAAANSS